MKSYGVRFVLCAWDTQKNVDLKIKTRVLFCFEMMVELTLASPERLVRVLME